MRKWLNRVGLALTLAAFIGVVALVGCRVQELGSTNFYGLDITVPTEVATATPGVLIDSAAVSAPFEIRKNHTPVFQVNGSGALDIEGGLDVAPWARVVAPTGIATATPALRVNSSGVSALIEAEKNSTRVFEVTGAGNIDAEGSLDIATGAIIAAPTAQATTVPVLEVDGLGVSNLIEARIANTPVWQVANDGDVSNPAGTLILADAVAVDGQEDAVQLTVQGNATQTSNPFVVEQSDGTDVFTVSNAGAIVVASTADIKGDVSDSGGTFTVADDMLVEGQAIGAVPLTVRGYPAGYENLLRVEDSEGNRSLQVNGFPTTDNFSTRDIVKIQAYTGNPSSGTNTMNMINLDASAGTATGGTNSLRGLLVGSAPSDALVTKTGVYVSSGWDTDIQTTGAVVVGGTLDAQGNVADSGGSFTIADNALIDGAADAIQLTVQGNATQTSALMAVEESGGTDVVTIKQAPGADSGATVSLVEIAGANPINTAGTQTLEGLTIDMAVGDSSGGTNKVNAVSIDGITGDAEVMESAILLGDGWDIHLSGPSTGLDMGIGSTVAAVVDSFSQADTGETSSLLELLGTTPIHTTGTNTMNGLTVDLAIGDASGGTNSAVGVQIDGITGDAEVTETAINVGAGWDTDIQTTGNIVVGGTSDLQGNVADSGGTFTVADNMAITGQANAVQLTVTGYTTQTNAIMAVESAGGLPTLEVYQVPAVDKDDSVALIQIAGNAQDNTTGTNNLYGVKIGLNAGNPSGGTNALYGLYLEDIIGDAQQTETAINVGSGWDVGLSIDGTILDPTGAVTVADDFTVSAGVVSIPVGTEHIGLRSIISTPITYTAAAGGSGTVATIADGEDWLVERVYIVVTESFAADGDDATLTVGDGNVATGFLNVADAGLQSTYAAATGWAAGYYGLKDGEQGSYLADGSLFIYTPSGGPETIDWVVGEGAGTTLSAGAATIYVVYTRLQ